MPHTADILVKDGNPVTALTNLFRSLLDTGAVNAILLPCRQGENRMVMPALVSDPDRLADADPLSPAFALNAARMVSRLTRQPSGGTLAAVLRPCEIRAFIELVKLHQGTTENLVLIGMDCPGAMANLDFFAFAELHGAEATDRFIRSAFSQTGDIPDAPEIASACRICTRPVPDGADLAIGLFGLPLKSRIQLYGQTARGEAVMAKSGFRPAEIAPERQTAIEALISRRGEARREMIAHTRAATDSLEKLADYFARCVNCYNCRVACPVCYCRECVFVTDVFDHEPAQYLRWAHRNGSVKMPTDTLFYHITRMAHMSTACVGCGQCSNACPSRIPVMELFVAMAVDTQEAFGYVPGRDLDEPPPMTIFNESEFEDVVG